MGLTRTDVSQSGGITTTDVKRLLNLGHTDVVARTLCLSKKVSFSITAYIPETSLPSDFIAIIDVKYRDRFLNFRYVDELNAGGTGWLYETGTPYYFLLPYGRKTLRLYPYYTSSASTTTLNGALTDSATSITLTSTADFHTEGRIIIDSEVIAYSNKSSTQLLGCIRGKEGTTAASHLTLATVTDRNIIYSYYYTPTDLSTETDTMDIQVEYHMLPIFYACTVFYRSRKKDDKQAAYYLALYEDGINKMREQIQGSQYQRIPILGDKCMDGLDDWDFLGRYPGNFGISVRI